MTLKYNAQYGNFENIVTESLYEIVHNLPDRVRVRLSALRCDDELAAGLEEVLQNEPGVREVQANARTASLTISFNPALFDPLQWLSSASFNELRRPVLKAQKLAQPTSEIRRATFAFEKLVKPGQQFVLGALSLAVSLSGLPVWLTRSIAGIALLPVINRALQTALEERRLGADALDAGSCAVLIQEGHVLPAGIMLTLIGLGELVRDLVTEQCELQLKHQYALTQRSAWLVRGDHRIRVPISDLLPGDRIVVYPGEVIGIDGFVMEGGGTVAAASSRLDFAPVEIKPGDLVSKDTVLIEGKLYIRNEQVFANDEQSSDPAKEKQKKQWLQRTQLHKNALKAGYAGILPMISLAGLVFAITRNIEHALALICFDFITGVKIAIPTAVLSSMANAGRHGVFIKNAAALEQLANLDVVVFSRSGTLTTLKPVVTEVFVADGFTGNEVTRLAAAVAQRYNHMAAYAIFRHANTNRISVPERQASRLIGGLGVEGRVEGKTILFGRTRLLEENGVDLGKAKEFLDACSERGDSRACIAINGQLAGIIAFQDPVRPDAFETIQNLRALGISEIVMTTGGSKEAAEAFAKKLQIDQVHYRTLPQDEAAIVKSYKDRGLKVALVGDDVHDSLALEQADLAITFQTGAEVARYRADVILSSEDLMDFARTIEIARSGMHRARQNLMLATVPNSFGLLLSLFTQTNVIAATLLNNGSVAIAALNGIWPLLDKESASSVRH